MNFLIHRTLSAASLTGLMLAGALAFATEADAELDSVARANFQPVIREALVYPDRAVITRAGDAEVRPGRQLLVWSGAPAELDPESLRAFSDDASVSISGVRSRLERRTDFDNPEVRRLNERVRDLERRRDAERDRGARAKIEVANLDRYALYLNQAIARQSGGAAEDSQRWSGAFALLTERRVKAATELQSADEAAARLEEELETARKALAELASAGRKNYRVVEIALQASSAKKVALTLSYLIKGAAWRVSYNMHLQEDGALLVEYFGDVTQQTGEDWINAELSLSTAQPARGARRSPIRPVYVSARETQTTREFEQVQREATEQNIDTPAETTPQNNTGGFAELESSGESLIFRIPRRATIPSSGESRRVAIARFVERPEESFFHAAPAVQRTPQLALRVKNTRSFPLLAGPVNAFRGSGFVGRSSVRYTPPGASFEVGLGAERSVSLLRAVRNARESAGALSSDNFFYTRIEVDLENQSDVRRTVALYERTPVSDVADVKIELLPETTAGYVEKPANSGVYMWRIELGPREKRRVQLYYRVRAPANYPGEIYGR